jgi:hypothetical protein
MPLLQRDLRSSFYAGGPVLLALELRIPLFIAAAALLAAQ